MLGGRGVRFGSSTPKQFHDISGLSAQEKVLFELTTSRLLSISTFGLALFVIPRDSENQELVLFDKALARLKKQYPQVRFEFTNGGSNRHESFEKAFTYLNTKKSEPDVLVVHDANRPFLSDHFLKRINQEIKKIDQRQVCSIPTIPAIDSLVFENGSQNQDILRYLSRERVHHVQTPQLLWWEAVLAAFEKKTKGASWSDEGSFLFDMGFTIATYAGEVNNKKITYKTDLDV